MMRNIINELNVGKATPARWKAERLKDMGKLNQTNVKLLKRYESILRIGTEAEIKQAQTDALYRMNTIYAKAAPDLAPSVKGVSKATARITEAYISQGGEGLNYTMQSLLKGSASSYREIIEKTSFNFIHGVDTLDEALSKTVSKWITGGNIPIKDAIGRTWSPESYSRMILRTNNRQVATEVTFQRNREFGNTIIEISSHVGAREGCAPYQGHVYDTAGKSKKFPSLASTTYGEPDGIFGINCRHDSYPFIDGVSTKSFDPLPFDEKAYKVTQAQRRAEVNIRDAKRKLALEKQNNNPVGIKRANLAVKGAQKDMRNFIDKTGRTRYYARERVFT